MASKEVRVRAMLLLICVGSLAMSWNARAASEPADPPDSTKKEAEPSRRCEPGPRDVLAVDAVELVRSGKDVPGDEAHTAVHGAYTYRFATAANREEFLKDPAKYEIQLGGACARMGPLSGVGSPKQRVVHEGRIYIFASGACRAAFSKKPELYLETIDPRPTPPTPDAKAIEDGRAIFSRAIAAHGGERAIAALRSIRLTTVGEADNQGEKVATGTIMRMAFGPADRGAGAAEALRQEERWGEYAWGSAVRGADGWLYDRKSVKVMAASQRAALARIGSRPLVAVLRGGLAPEAVVWKVEGPTPKAEEAAMDFVSVWMGMSVGSGDSGGYTCTLGIDRATGRVMSQRFRGRGANMTIGEIEQRLTDFREVSGVLLPFAMERTFNGSSAASDGGGKREYREIVANEGVDVEDLARAK